MSKRTTIITGSDGRATTVVTRRSGCGCLTILAAAVVLFGPAAWFPPPLAVVAYVALGIIALLAGTGWLLQNRRAAPLPQPAPEPPPAPPPL
jgi:hypothetical protein